MGISRVLIPVTTDGSGAGTAVSARPVNGEILEIRLPTAALNAAGAADYTITRQETGGTVLAITNTDGPWTRYPRGDAITPAGAGGSAVVPIPCDEMLRLVVAQAATSASGTIHVYYKGF